MGRSWALCQASSTLEQLFQMMVPNQRFFQGLHKPLQALTKLNPIWRDNNKSLVSKVKLIRSLVISIFLYAYESWALTAVREKNAGL